MNLGIASQLLPIPVGATVSLADGNFVLIGNEDYRLQVAHNLQSDSITPHSINEARTEREAGFIQRASFQLELRADQKVIEVQEPRVFITGSYDVNYFYLRTKDLLSAHPTIMTIDYVAKPPPLINLDTKISLTMKLRPHVRFPWRKLILLLVFATIYAITNLFPVIFQHCPPSALMRQIGWVEEGRISGSKNFRPGKFHGVGHTKLELLPANAVREPVSIIL